VRRAGAVFAEPAALKTWYGTHCPGRGQRDTRLLYGGSCPPVLMLVLRGHVPIVRVPGCRRLWFDRKDLDRCIEASKERAE